MTAGQMDGQLVEMSGDVAEEDGLDKLSEYRLQIGEKADSHKVESPLRY